MFTIPKSNFVKNQARKVSDIYEYSKNDVTLPLSNDAQKLGQGSYGLVYKAVHRETKIERAIKIIHKASVKQKERLEMELRTMELLDHPHVIRVFETYEDAEYIYIVMEYQSSYLLRICGGGDIFDKVLELGNFAEKDALTIFVQIARAINYYQSRLIVHRDLKPENFLFQLKHDLESLFIIDFGLARIYQHGVQQLWTKAGTAYYVAPEVLSGKYDNRCDLWSAGVMLYVLLCGYPPFYGETEVEILHMIQRGKFDFDGVEWTQVSLQARDLICRLLTIADQRLGMEEILKHEWVQRFKQQGEVILTKGHLDRWQQYTPVKQVGLLYLATQLGQAEIKRFKESFLYMNESQSGVLQSEEIQKFCGCQFQKLEYSRKKFSQSRIHRDLLGAANIQVGEIPEADVPIFDKRCAITL